MPHLAPFNRYTLLGFQITSLALLLSAAPAFAQTATPGAPSEGVERAVERAVEVSTEAVERIGIAAFVPAIVSVIALLLVVGFIYVLIRIGVAPLLNIIRDEREARKQERDERIQKERELTELRERQAQAADTNANAQLKQAEAMEKQAQVAMSMSQQLSGIENKTEAKARTYTAVTTINQHTDTAHAKTLVAIQTMLDTALEGLTSYQSKRSAQHVQDDGATADLTLPEVQRTLLEAKEQVTKLNDTGPLGDPALAEPTSTPELSTESTSKESSNVPPHP